MIRSISDWDKMIPALMIATGVVLAVIGFIAGKRQQRPAESQEKEKGPERPRSRVASLPEASSTGRAEHQHKKE